MKLVWFYKNVFKFFPWVWSKKFERHCTRWNVSEQMERTYLNHIWFCGGVYLGHKLPFFSSLRTCYVLHCVPPKKFTYWIPNPQYLRMWVNLEIGPLRRWLTWNETIRVDPNLIWLVSEENFNTKRDTWDVHSQTRDHVSTQGSGRHASRGKESQEKSNLPKSWS